MICMSLPKRLVLLAVLWFSLPWGFTQTRGDQIGPITSALRAKQFDKALQLLQPALQQLPKDAQLWTLRGLALLGERHNEEALVAFRRALNISRDYLPALEGAAQIEYEAGDKEAIPLLQRLLRLRPNDSTSHAMLAVLSYKRGDCATAVQHFEQSGPVLDSQPSALQEYGACLARLKQMEKAISVFRRRLDRDPADRDARYHLATVQLMAERPKDTIETMTPLLQANKADAKSLALAASAYEASGETPDAVRLLRQAIVSDPRNIDLYLDFANISMDHQSFQVGIAMINSGLALQPNAPQLYVARGVLYVQLAQYDEAEADFEKADELDPRQSIGAAALGLEAVQKKDPDQALATVRSELEKKPNDPYLLYLQADILNQKAPDAASSEFQAALRSAKKAVALQPALGPAHDLLGKLYLQAGQNQQAISQCRKALNISPKDQTALYHLIQALRKTGDKAELPGLLKRLAQLRQEATKQEEQRSRYKLIVGNSPAIEPAQP